MTLACSLNVSRWPERFRSNDRRVIARFFPVGDEGRIERVIERVMSLDDEEVEAQLEQVIEHFGKRHRNVHAAFDDHFDCVRDYVQNAQTLSPQRRLLIGAYFTMEYSIESAALFNPSIVPHPDQSEARPGEARFIMSLRATGEGHLSSIVFRTGTIHENAHITFDPAPDWAARMRISSDSRYEKRLFGMKLNEMGAANEASQMILDQLDETFTYDQLTHAVSVVDESAQRPEPFTETAENTLWLARSNYHLHVPVQTEPSEIVIFPTSENESHGIEDVRLTQFIDDNGQVTYYGTYTAYNGYRILPQLLETKNFLDFEVYTLNGRYVQNKGMALFPRKINGQYCMIGRIDGENMHIMRSDNVHFWNQAEMLRMPTYPWEFVQIGNCGPPLETQAGWLLLTHGVGPVRQYCIGASLLDRDDPTKVIGHLPRPLLVPEEDERNGYVPNVVYSCGAMIHERTLIIPYAISDTATTFATVNLQELIDHMLEVGGLSEPFDARTNIEPPDQSQPRVQVESTQTVAA